MRYKGYTVEGEVPAYERVALDGRGQPMGHIGNVNDDTEPLWYVVRDKKDDYLESLESFNEAKRYIDWLVRDDGTTFEFLVGREAQQNV